MFTQTQSGIGPLGYLAAEVNTYAEKYTDFRQKQKSTTKKTKTSHVMNEPENKTKTNLGITSEQSPAKIIAV